MSKIPSKLSGSGNVTTAAKRSAKQPVAAASVAKPTAAPQPATEMQIPIGPRVLELLEVAYRARRAVLLEGPTGVGKSQIVAEAANQLGIEYRVLDLSLLEPPDLVGLPVIEAGRTRYAAPAELPTSGRGILMLEELNRAEIPVMQPALQLLSARRLHAYTLPEGWSCVAAVNPENGEYQVNQLDPALRSRFMQLSVCADRQAWLAWAERALVHPVIVAVVRAHDDAFVTTSPRSWAYASDVLHVLRASELSNEELLRAALRGYLPITWALTVAQELGKSPSLQLPDAVSLLGPEGPKRLASCVAEFERAGRSDAISVLAASLRRVLRSDDYAQAVRSGALTLATTELLVQPLPGDLLELCLEAAVSSAAAPELALAQGFEPAKFIVNYIDSAQQQRVRKFRGDMRVHMLLLVANATMAWLANADVEQAVAAPQSLRALAADLGHVGKPLLRWLSARGVQLEA
jgi:hypothetical protein